QAVPLKPGGQFTVGPITFRAEYFVTANNCGKSGPEWQADMRTLMKWCASKSPQDAQARLNMRKEALEACGAN
ncbi:MAG: hypothetical protein K0U34_06065, partial [Alphaproteobacteria bacterium]|nr:hypothetical protein [Alphaproteobacteria bacterium]